MPVTRRNVKYALIDNKYWPAVTTVVYGAGYVANADPNGDAEPNGDGMARGVEYCYFFQSYIFLRLSTAAIKGELALQEHFALMDTQSGADALSLAAEFERYYNQVSMPVDYRPQVGDLVLVTEGSYPPWPAKVIQGKDVSVTRLNGDEESFSMFRCSYVGHLHIVWIESAMIRPFTAGNAMKACVLAEPRTHIPLKERNEQRGAIVKALIENGHPIDPDSVQMIPGNVVEID